MQLNSLTIISKDTTIQYSQKLAIYDHKYAKINQQIFIYGKNAEKPQIQTSLHKLNCNDLSLNVVSTFNPPLFNDFIIFSSRQILYFWGKTIHQHQNQIYQFDGYKFNQLKQNGKIPNIQSVYAYCIFSFNFLLIFSYQIEQQQQYQTDRKLQNKWYIFDIQKKYWLQAFCNIQIPFCQKAKLIWENGKGYLLLQSIFNLNTKIYEKNLLYEVNFKSFSSNLIKCQKINFPNQIKNQNIIITDMISSNFINLIFIAQQHKFINQFKRQTLQSQQSKNILILNLQTLEWSLNVEKIKLIGNNGLLIIIQNKLLQIGGYFMSQLLKQIQIFQIKYFQKQVDNNIISIKYQQSRCYNCQQAFTYKQNFIYQPFIQKQFDSSLNKVKVQMKFLNKIAKKYINQFQAICNIVDFINSFQCNQVQINLKEQINQSQQFNYFRNKIEKQMSCLIQIGGKSCKFCSIQELKNIFNIQMSQNLIDDHLLCNYSIQLSKLNICSLVLGTGILFITLTGQNKIFVCYTSCSSVEFPQINIKSFPKIYYTINLNQEQKISSPINRQIIFQNTRLYFANQQVYQKIKYFKTVNNKKVLNENHYFIYVIGVNKLTKKLKSQNNIFSNRTTYQDIIIKDRTIQKGLNGLHKYLKHYYLKKYLKINLLGSVLNHKNLNQIFQSLQKNKMIKIKTIIQQKINKKQLQQTNFTTTSDQSSIYKDIQIIQKCILYQINNQNLKDFDKFYQAIFIYHKKKLFKIIKSKNQKICGIIQIFDHIQVILTQNDFLFKNQKNKLNQWINNIQLINQNEK